MSKGTSIWILTLMIRYPAHIQIDISHEGSSKGFINTVYS